MDYFLSSDVMEPPEVAVQPGGALNASGRVTDFGVRPA
jgi:hypothetical protein